MQVTEWGDSHTSRACAMSSNSYNKTSYIWAIAYGYHSGSFNIYGCLKLLCIPNIKKRTCHNHADGRPSEYSELTDI